MKTRLQISFEIGDAKKLQRLCKDYKSQIPKGLMKLILDAMMDEHCYYGEGKEGALFMWGILEDMKINLFDFLQTHKHFWRHIQMLAIKKGTPIIFLKQSISEGSVMAYSIYGVYNGELLLETGDLPFDWVVYNL